MTQIKTVCVDKVAYDAVLRNSVRVNDLEAENIVGELKSYIDYLNKNGSCLCFCNQCKIELIENEEED